MNPRKLLLDKVFPYLLVVGGMLGLLAFLTLTYDTLKISHNVHYTPSCNLNPVLSCGSVITAGGDTIFGLPIAVYGVAACAVLITSGVTLLAGAKVKRWYWLTFQVLFTVGTVGAYVLLFKSVYRIKALCPYCLSLDIILTTLFWYLTLYNVDHGTITITGDKNKQVYHWIRRHHLDVLVAWFVVVIALVLQHFWYYYGKHL